MKGLIPLMLQPAAGPSRQSVVFPCASSSSKPASPTKMTFGKRARSASPALPSTTKPLPELPTEEKPAAPFAPVPVLAAPAPAPPVVPAPAEPVVARKPARRISVAAPPTLPVLPYTPSEWSKAVAEVKRQFTNRRFRPCSVRCGEILDNIKNPGAVEPAYLIYLHFYGAASLEMSAKPLHASSPYRNNLLRQARTHYQRAAELIQTEDHSMKRFSSRHSCSTTTTTTTMTTSTPSMHSPACSVSSRTWTESTGLSSPTPSIASLEEEIERMVLETAPATKKKRVTFSDMVVEPAEPIIRPDSPTLGFDEWLGRSSPDPQPEPVMIRQLQPLHEEAPAGVVGEDDGEAAVTTDADLVVEQDVDDALFLRDRSIHRYCGLLRSLRGQVTSHLDSVEAQLARPTSLTARASGDLSPLAISRAATPEVMAVASDNDELRALEIRARIERLRQNGWQRKRFDPSRYETLREQALAELE